MEEDNSQSEDEAPKQGYPSPPSAPANPPESQPAPPAPDNAQPKSPNGVKTPQDIFNELQQMRRKQAQQQRTN